MSKEKMKTTYAKSYFSIDVDCPYCENSIDATTELTPYLDDDKLSAESIEAEITCSECNKIFIVESIY